jgi:hypothetical protein
MNLIYYTDEDVLRVMVEKINKSELSLDECIELLLKYKDYNQEKIIEILNNENEENLIMDIDYSNITIDPMIFENKQVEYDISLMEIAIPIIEKYFPTSFLNVLSEEVIVEEIINGIMNTIIYENTIEEISYRIDEFLSSANILIPTQGLQKQENSYEIVKYGIFVPRLFKKINKNEFENPKQIKDVLSDFKFMDYTNPMINLIPKLIYKVKGEKR